MAWRGGLLRTGVGSGRGGHPRRPCGELGADPGSPAWPSADSTLSRPSPVSGCARPSRDLPGSPDSALESGLVDLVVRDAEGSPALCRCSRTLSPRPGAPRGRLADRRRLPRRRRHQRRGRCLRRAPVRGAEPGAARGAALADAASGLARPMAVSPSGPRCPPAVVAGLDPGRRRLLDLLVRGRLVMSAGRRVRAGA